MTTIIQLLKSRTVLFALLLAVLSVLQGYVGPVGAGIGAAIILLRFLTTVPLSEK